VIASSQDDEDSIAWPDISVFTYALIEGLCGIGTWAPDGLVPVASLAMYTGRRVPWLTKDKQHPTLNFERADNYPVAYYAGGAKNLPASPLAPPPTATATLPAATNVRQRMRGLLMRLYPTEGEARVLADDAGLPTGSVPVSTAPKVIWDGILKAAEHTGAMLRLIAAVDSDGYEEGDEWRTIREDYLLLIGHRTGPMAISRHELRVLDGGSRPDTTTDAVRAAATLRDTLELELPLSRPPTTVDPARAGTYLIDARRLADRVSSFAADLRSAGDQQAMTVARGYRHSRVLEDVLAAADGFRCYLDTISTPQANLAAAITAYDLEARALIDAVARLASALEAQADAE
jgi:hypothetical protein